MEKLQTFELGNGIYWVGGGRQKGHLHCNPYLLIDEEEGVLFDPGSVLDFKEVYENITNIIPIEKIKYVILHHQDPDLCGSVPLFEKKGAHFKVVTHWRTQTIVKYYDIKSSYYIVNEHNFSLTLKSGRTLNFIPTPYLHFPGAITTYDTLSKVLFSSDLFGAIANEWQLFAQDDYIEKMKAFHEHYMPSNDILRPVMEVFLGMDINMIAPQHGSIIKKDIKKHIRILRDLECGAFLKPIRKELSKSGGYAQLCSAVLQRYAAIFNKDEVLEMMKNLAVTINQDTLEIMDYHDTGDILWEKIFQQMILQRKIQGLLVIEPFVEKLSEQFDIPMPNVFKTTIKKAYLIAEENQQLKNLNRQLEEVAKETQEKLIRCPVTHLYNYTFFKNYMTNILTKDIQSLNAALIIINFDNMAHIRFSYGDEAVDEVLRSTVYLMDAMKEEKTLVFRLQGAAFAYYMPHTSKDAAIQKAEEIRNAVAKSEKYIERITMSVGVVDLAEIKKHDRFDKHPFEILYELAMLRVRLARNRGKNIVCSHSDVENYQEKIGKILVVDTDEVNIDIIKTFLENLSYEVFTAHDGDMALKIAEREVPDAIISETMLPKKDVFLLRERLLMQSQTKHIVFIIVSHLKNEDAIKRALSLGISYYLKKPFMLSELFGIIQLNIKGDAFQ